MPRPDKTKRISNSNLAPERRYDFNFPSHILDPYRKNIVEYLRNTRAERVIPEGNNIIKVKTNRTQILLVRRLFVDVSPLYFQFRSAIIYNRANQQHDGKKVFISHRDLEEILVIVWDDVYECPKKKILRGRFKLCGYKRKNRCAAENLSDNGNWFDMIQYYDLVDVYMESEQPVELLKRMIDMGGFDSNTKKLRGFAMLFTNIGGEDYKLEDLFPGDTRSQSFPKKPKIC